eukprot:scaffold4086_cov129-Isochrysis_galbana.AAC.4
MNALLMTSCVLATPASATPASVPKGMIRVCTNKSCRKDGAHDTLAVLRLLASTAAADAAVSDLGTSASNGAAVQAAFAAEHVEACGCLGQCGKGPNVALCDGAVEKCELFHDVHKPRSARALLSEAGLSISDEAAGAVLKRAFALRALRECRPDEARDLVTAGLNQAGALRLDASYLLSEMLELRADISDELRDSDAAAADRVQAERLRAATPQAA